MKYKCFCLFVHKQKPHYNVSYALLLCQKMQLKPTAKGWFFNIAGARFTPKKYFLFFKVHKKSKLKQVLFENTRQQKQYLF